MALQRRALQPIGSCRYTTNILTECFYGSVPSLYKPNNKLIKKKVLSPRINNVVPKSGDIVVPLCGLGQLSHMLAEHGYDKYIQLFRYHEIEISTFARLTNADLFKMGLTNFYDRFSILLLIKLMPNTAAFLSYSMCMKVLEDE